MARADHGGPAAPEERHAGLSWQSQRLSTKLVLFSTALTTLLLAAVFLGLSVEMRRGTRELLVEALGRSQQMFLEQQERSQRQVLWASSLMTQNPTLRAAIETYRLEADSDGHLRDDLLATIRNEVEKTVAGLGHDLVIVTDEEGRVLAARATHGAAPESGSDLSPMPLLRAALGETEAGGTGNFAAARFAEQTYLAGTVPISMQGFVIGTLTLAERIDADLVEALRESSGGEVVVTVAGRVEASTLDDLGPGEAIPEILGLHPAERTDPAGRMRIGNQEYVAAPLELDGDADVALYLLHSVSGMLADSMAELLRTILLYAVAAFILGALGAWAMARSSLWRLERFVQLMRTVASTGDYSRRFDMSEPGSHEGRKTGGIGLSYELRQLIDAFNQMLTQIQARDAELRLQIRERRQTEKALHETAEQLQQSQKLEALGQLAGGVAHDFNNLLTIITGYSDLMLRGLDERDPRFSKIEEIRKAGERAASLTRQLLAFSRKQVMEPRVLDLNEVVDNVEKMLRRLIGEHIRLRTSLDESLGHIKADPGQIEQVILNLAINARDAMPGGGSLRVETYHDGLDGSSRHGAVCLRVRDTGCGMDEDVRQRVFEPFFTTKGPGKGTGLGLSMVYGIVKQSGGRIDIDSSPGSGTTVTIRFPRCDDRADRVSETRGASELPGGAETLLLVEDEEPVRSFAREILERAGYTVLEACHGGEALVVGRDHPGPIHLMVTDVVMPHLNGHEAYQRLAGFRPDMKVLFTSGYPDHPLVRGDGRTGAELPYLQKPFTSDGLATKVRMVLDDRDGS